MHTKNNEPRFSGPLRMVSCYLFPVFALRLPGAFSGRLQCFVLPYRHSNLSFSSRAISTLQIIQKGLLPVGCEGAYSLIIFSFVPPVFAN